MSGWVVASVVCSRFVAKTVVAKRKWDELLPWNLLVRLGWLAKSAVVVEVIILPYTFRGKKKKEVIPVCGVVVARSPQELAMCAIKRTLFKTNSRYN